MISSTLLLLPLFVAVARATDHQVIVGGSAGLVYTPSNITAMVGDTVQFIFQAKNHTATQAAFASPCKPLADAYGNLIGFNSGFNPVGADVTSNFPTFNITVNDTSPIWVYCAQPGPPTHCSQGMVFSVNAPLTGNTIDKFRAAAIATGSGVSSSSGYSYSSSSNVYSSAAATTTAWTSPPPPVIVTETATVTVDNSVYTTTYDAYEGASPNPTPDAQPAVHTIVVGGTDLVYTPPTINASLGDIVMFKFNVKNHTVTQSNFNTPCTKNGGFDSGFMPVSANATEFPTFNITVNTTEPIWGYCRQPGPPAHCSKGMVFGINAPGSGSNTFAAFQGLAEHTNTSNAAASPSSSSSSSSSGAGRAAVSAGFTVGVVGVLAFALL